MCLGWLDEGERYLCESIGFEYKSVWIQVSVRVMRVSRKGTEEDGVETVNLTDW